MKPVSYPLSKNLHSGLAFTFQPQKLWRSSLFGYTSPVGKSGRYNNFKNVRNRRPSVWGKFRWGKFSPRFSRSCFFLSPQLHTAGWKLNPVWRTLVIGRSLTGFSYHISTSAGFTPLEGSEHVVFIRHTEIKRVAASLSQLFLLLVYSRSSLFIIPGRALSRNAFPMGQLKCDTGDGYFPSRQRNGLARMILLSVSSISF